MQYYLTTCHPLEATKTIHKTKKDSQLFFYRLLKKYQQWESKQIANNQIFTQYSIESIFVYTRLFKIDATIDKESFINRWLINFKDMRN